MEEISKKTKEIVDLFKKFPHSRVLKKPKKLSAKVEQEQIVKNVGENLDYIRICVKYNLFDLEATERENAYLRKILEESQ